MKQYQTKAIIVDLCGIIKRRENMDLKVFQHTGKYIFNLC